MQKPIMAVTGDETGVQRADVIAFPGIVVRQGSGKVKLQAGCTLTSAPSQAVIESDPFRFVKRC